MALHLLHRTLRVWPDQCRAEAEFLMTGGVADVPAIGSAASWVERVGGEDIGAGWCIAGREIVPSQDDVIRLTARVPGHDWTHVGLRPIQHAAKPYTYLVIGDGSSVFSNWAEGDVIDNSTLIQYDIEWLDTVSRLQWRYRSNGAFPTGFSDWLPSTGTGRWTALKFEIRGELSMDIVTGTTSTLWRHFATLRLAPITTGSKPLTWNLPSWGS